MALSQGRRPILDGLQVNERTLSPSAVDTSDSNKVFPTDTTVRLAANVNDANDWITLPALASVPNGHRITVIAGAVGCEVRTPNASAEEINSEDCDSTKEYILAATQIHYFTKIDDTIGWMGNGYTALGTAATAIVPD